MIDPSRCELLCKQDCYFRDVHLKHRTNTNDEDIEHSAPVQVKRNCIVISPLNHKNIRNQTTTLEIIEYCSETIQEPFKTINKPLSNLLESQLCPAK